MVKILHRSKSKFYLSEINSAASKNTLFAICNQLLRLEKLAPFPNMYLMLFLFIFLLLIELSKLELA